MLAFASSYLLRHYGNCYKVIQNFSKLYAIINYEEKRNLFSYLIKEIQLYPNKLFNSVPSRNDEASNMIVWGRILQNIGCKEHFK